MKSSFFHKCKSQNEGFINLVFKVMISWKFFSFTWSYQMSQWMRKIIHQKSTFLSAPISLYQKMDICSSGALKFISRYSLFNAIKNGCSPNCFVNKFRLNRQISVYLGTTYLIFCLKFLVKIVLKYTKTKQFYFFF